MWYDKASEDTVGLKHFFEKNKGNYQWDQRAVILSVNIDTTNKAIAEKFIRNIKRQILINSFLNSIRINPFILSEKCSREKINRLLRWFKFYKRFYDSIGAR